MLTIYDSLSQEKRPFKPVQAGKVGMYVCGMTTYDDCHIGHGRGFVVFDVIRRYLEARDYQVTFVRNITDIDDKIIQRANENGETAKAWAERFIASTFADMQALQVKSADYDPRATEYVPQMIALIEVLIARDFAYVAESGDVCFRVRHFDDYGKLSKRDLDNLRAGARIEIGEGKEDPLDFVLWKKAKPGEPSWASPWGDGRPGWHIECSAMAGEILGVPFDIHGGGMDLKFPHHENEIAQSEAACDCNFANYWMHLGLVQVNDEKMSKSLGNFSTIKSVLADEHPEVVRYFMVSAHYRSPVNYAERVMVASRQALQRLYTSLRDLALPEKTSIDKTGQYWLRFQEAMDDDFNTPEALAVLFSMSHEINRLKEQSALAEAADVAGQLKAIAALFGFLQEAPETFLKQGASDEESAWVEALLQERQNARQQKDWARADEIRDLLAEKQIVIEDGAEGTTWRKLSA